MLISWKNADISRTQAVCHAIHIFFGSSLGKVWLCQFSFPLHSWAAPKMPILNRVNNIVFWNHMTNSLYDKIIISSTNTVPMAMKLGRMVTCCKRLLLPIMPQGSWVTWPCNITWEKNFHYIISTTRFMGSKLGRLLTYFE